MISLIRIIPFTYSHSNSHDRLIIPFMFPLTGYNIFYSHSSSGHYRIPWAYFWVNYTANLNCWAIKGDDSPNKTSDYPDDSHR